MMKANDRYTWALEKMGLSPNDNILEIGFGAGILIDLMARHPASVGVTGIEKSTASNSSRVRGVLLKYGDRVRLLRVSFPSPQLEGAVFSKIVAFNVPFFKHVDSQELSALRSHLLPGGRVFAFYQNPGPVLKSDVSRISMSMMSHGFEIVAAGIDKVGTGSCLYVISRSAD